MVSLSQILRQVKLWIGEVDSDSDNGVVVGLDCGNECMCLSKILTHLIVLLTVESRYVKHLACNVLAVVSEFVAASGSHWDAFIRLLCDCVDFAITAAVSCSTPTSATGASDLCSSSSSLILVLKPKVKNGDWSVAAGVVRVLRHMSLFLGLIFNCRMMYYSECSYNCFVYLVLQRNSLKRKGDHFRIQRAMCFSLSQIFSILYSYSIFFF